MKKALKEKTRALALGLIDEPSSIARIDIDPEALQDLAANIAENGLLQRVLVAPNGDRFEIIFGHRRFLAHKLLGKTEINCVIREMDALQRALARASENNGRVDLSPIEEATQYADLRDNHNLTIAKVAKLMGKSGGVVKRRLDLLKMPPQLQQAIHKKQISYSVAEELWSLGDIAAIDYYLGYAVDHGATQAVMRGWVKDWRDAKRRKETGAVGSGELRAPMETRPVYVSCDLCVGPMEIGAETTIRCCPQCTELVKQALKG